MSRLHRLHLLILPVLLLSACQPESSGPIVSNEIPDPAPTAKQTGIKDGYELWLRYRPVGNPLRLQEYRNAFGCIKSEPTSAVVEAAISELQRGLSILLETDIESGPDPTCTNPLIVGTVSSRMVSRLNWVEEIDLAAEGFIIRREGNAASDPFVIAGGNDKGVLYGAFALLRHLRSGLPHETLGQMSSPRINRRILNHWDNLDGSVERGYAGSSLWDWEALPNEISPRYHDYARANASIGINGTVLTNVNADARVLTPEYLEKAAALADTFRPWGIRVYLTARFSAPIEIGGLGTADPAEESVRQWWADKSAEIYRSIPDFGGLLVKANSEGQPGPQDYGRSHADGANMLADALAPHGGIVMWRAFVYSHEEPADRIRQAYDEFQPLDGGFRENVMVQVKNGPLDFQPREPFHPLFGAMPETPIALELQITKEYLGQDTHLVYLAPLFREVLHADTYRSGAGSTVARVIDGTLHGNRLTAIAGVANIGTDRDWTGSHFNQANWYAFGRLAWNPDLSAEAIAEEWIRATFSKDPGVVRTIAELMMVSREAVVNYMTPLGLVHIMAEGHHYGPGPWVDNLPRADWNSTYYHRADRDGIGFDRTAEGSNAVEQYADTARRMFSDQSTVPDELLLYFHRVGWRERLHSGRTLWEELVKRYDSGVSEVESMEQAWAKLADRIDSDRHADVAEFLRIQKHEARWWRDAVLAYFMDVAGLELPAGHEPPAHGLDFYRDLACPPDRDKPRCEAIY